MGIIAAFSISPEENTSFSRLEAHACQQNGLFGMRCRARCEPLSVCAVDLLRCAAGLLGVRQPGQQRGLRYIWKNIVRLASTTSVPKPL